LKFIFSAVKVDPGFSSFYDYCKSVGVPVKIVSRYEFAVHEIPLTCITYLLSIPYDSGIYSVIEPIMENFIGDRAKEIEIISNGGGVEDRKWNIQWRDNT
jgi:2-hydroxy-3-keto-5-methylthiopentenyl-1-phosphate phosphatase